MRYIIVIAIILWIIYEVCKTDRENYNRIDEGIKERRIDKRDQKEIDKFFTTHYGCSQKALCNMIRSSPNIDKLAHLITEFQLLPDTIDVYYDGIGFSWGGGKTYKRQDFSQLNIKPLPKTAYHSHGCCFDSRKEVAEALSNKLGLSYKVHTECEDESLYIRHVYLQLPQKPKQSPYSNYKGW